MRIRSDHTRQGVLFRLFGRDGEVAYVVFKLTGLGASIEFPSYWHKRHRAWVCLGFGLARVAFSFPWSKTVPDEYQQGSGPKYGFAFVDDGLHLFWGKSKGGDRFKVVGMPWRWHHVDEEYLVLSEPETYRFLARLESGEWQERRATIRMETRTWVRRWIPWRRVNRYIDIRFDEEVGECTTSCTEEMKPGELPRDTLRRMERERLFT